MPVALKTVLLLTASNVFMTFAWYAHLKELKSKPRLVAPLRATSPACHDTVRVSIFLNDLPRLDGSISTNVTIRRFRRLRRGGVMLNTLKFPLWTVAGVLSAASWATGQEVNTPPVVQTP